MPHGDSECRAREKIKHGTCRESDVLDRKNKVSDKRKGVWRNGGSNSHSLKINLPECATQEEEKLKGEEIEEEKAEFIVYNRVLDLLLSQLGRHWKILKILYSREEAGSGCSKLGLSSDKERWCLKLGTLGRETFEL